MTDEHTGELMKHCFYIFFRLLYKLQILSCIQIQNGLCMLIDRGGKL